MSWHYLQGQEEVSSEAISWDGERFAPSKSKTILGEYCLLDKGMESCPTSPSGMILKHSMGPNGEEELMWYQGDSPVRTYLPPVKEKESQEADLDCGPRWPGSLARYNPTTYSWRTAQCSLFGGLTEFSGTWPRWGMMRDGECWELTASEPQYTENESGYWPAPMASDWHGAAHKQKKMNIRLNHFCYSIGRRDLEHCLIFREALMSWPIGWTDLKPLAMDKFQQWLNSHGRY